MNSLSASLIHYKYIINFANLLWIHYLFREFTMNLLLVLWFYYKFSRFFAYILFNSLPFTRIHYLFCETTMNLLFVSRLHYEFTVCFTNLLVVLWIYHKFNGLNSLLIHLVFCDLLWIYLLLQVHYEFTLFRGIIIIFAHLSCDHKLTICFTISLWIYYLFRESNINYLSVSWSHYLFRDFTTDLPSFSHYLFRE